MTGGVGGWGDRSGVQAIHCHLCDAHFVANLAATCVECGAVGFVTVDGDSSPVPEHELERQRTIRSEQIRADS